MTSIRIHFLFESNLQRKDTSGTLIVFPAIHCAPKMSIPYMTRGTQNALRVRKKIIEMSKESLNN